MSSVSCPKNTTAEALCERLRGELFLENFASDEDPEPTEYRLYSGGRWLDPTEYVKPDSVVHIRRAPVKLYFYVEGSEASDVPMRSELLVELSSLPRDLLPRLRDVFGRREPHLMRLEATKELLNLALPFQRQCVEAGHTIALVSIASIGKRTLSQVGKREKEGWLRKRSNMLTHRRFCVVAQRCLIYFKTDSADCPVQGVVPIDYYSVGTYRDPSMFRLASTGMTMGRDTTAEYMFSAEDGGWPEAVLKIKALPMMFGVPWHWHAQHVSQSMRMLTQHLEEEKAHELPGCFLKPQGSPTELAWFEELLDTGEMRREVLQGSDPRTILSLVKRYLCLHPGPLLPPTLSQAVMDALPPPENANIADPSADDEALASAVATTLRAIDPAEKGLLNSFFELLTSVLTFLSKCAGAAPGNGLSLSLLGRMFAPHVLSLPPNAPSAAASTITSTLIRLGPLISGRLSSAAPSNAAAPQSPRGGGSRGSQFFRFGDVTEESTIMDEDPVSPESFSPPDLRDSDRSPSMRVRSSTSPDNRLSSSSSLTSVPTARSPPRSPRSSNNTAAAAAAAVSISSMPLERRVEMLEALLREERSQRQILEQRVAVLEEALQRTPVALPPSSPRGGPGGSVGAGVTIGRSRVKSASEDAPPELPSRSTKKKPT